jgi:hypothetical protein
MSYIVSTSVEMRIFESEIDATISEKRSEKEDQISAKTDSITRIIDQKRIDLKNSVSKKANEHSNYVRGLDDELITLQEKIQNLQQELIDETQGEVGSGKKGNGPAAKRIAEVIQNTTSELASKQKRRDSLVNISVSFNELKDAKVFAKSQNEQLDKELQQIKDSENTRLNNVEISVSEGFLDRYVALQELKEQPYMSFLIWMIFLLFLLIEFLPILIKTFMNGGAYIAELAMQLKAHQEESLNAQKSTLLIQSVAHTNLVKKQESLLFKNNKAIESGRINDAKNSKVNELVLLKDTHKIETQIIDEKTSLLEERKEYLVHQASTYTDLISETNEKIDSLKSEDYNPGDDDLDDMKKFISDKFKDSME